ncbi:hypothetical protein [Aggregatilinea lenta]|uniref:hypothetical protein n=1 Tax=Aggregatilinea lenta TaxID=913108 RepID=UPI0013C2E812|nr:hypothetical protein [Aggregatilinea lenta]
MNMRKLTLLTTAVTLVLALGLTPLAVSAGTLPPADSASPAQGGPTPTPTDPTWIAFSAARDALEQDIHQDLTFVQQWTFDEMEFVGGIDDCRVMPEGEEPQQIYFGWRFLITTMGGAQYEVRTSFNAKIITICDQVTSGAAPAADTTADTSGLPAPVSGSAVSGGFEIGGQVTGMSGSTVNAMKSAGMTWVKLQLSMGQSGAGFITEAHANGFKILFSVVGDHNQVMNSAYQDQYAQFVGSLAASGADAIEIWNEMNIDREWPAGQINGSNYVPLLAKAYNAIKASNPNTLVITGALAPTGYFGAAGCTDQGCNDDAYLQQMATAGAGQYADCIGVHYNEGIISPTQSSGDPRDSYPTRYFGSMLSRALAPFGGKQACFTELGYLTPEGYGTLPGGFSWAQNTTIAQQAQWMAEAAVAAATSGRVRLMIVFNVDFTTWGSDPQAGYAIVRADGTCPACTALASVLQ